MTTATRLYRAIMFEVERRRHELGWPMWQVDDKAGTQDGYYAKCLCPETPNGRKARWETLQLLVDALFPKGVRLTIEADGAEMPTAISIDKGRNTNALMVRHWRHSQHFRELSRRAAIARLSKIHPRRRKAIARKASRARWQRYRERLGR